MKKGLTLLVFFIFLYAASCLAEESYYLITFSGPVMQEWKDQLAEFGVVFSSYIPDYSFVVMMNDSVKKNIEALDFVSSLSLYNPKSKFSSSLLSKRSSQKSKFYVFLHDSTKLEEVSDELLRLGVEVLSSSEGKLKVSALYSQLDLLSSIDSVSWVEEVPRYVLVNDVAANIISANFTWDSYNLTGSNLTVAISDSGLDTGFDDNMSLDFKGKVVMFNWWGSTPDDTNGHGTHTAGSLAGSGNYSYNQFKGMAYDANIVFQAIGDDEGTDTVYPPDPISELFIEAYNNNARVHSNSWGSTSNLGEYTSDSQSIDDFTWNYTDFVIVFAAGNMGGSGLGTVEFPSTAKNGLSIGATGNRAGNVDQVASFSSRGPCDDGRIKPDLVAPGYSVVSTKSTLGGTSCTSSYELNGNYSYCSGTSMATPIAGGAAAIVINHYQSSGVNPSAALVKATLINGAMDIGYGIPSNYSGWGRINLSESLNPPKPKTINYTDYTSGLSTGESSSYSYIVYNDSVPLKVTLVWTDYPSDLSAVKN
ncbi:MAG: S8 family serine peptidase, partial [Candidatus Nanoarchaeia archaeon]